jgi:hypothetical protein
MDIQVLFGIPYPILYLCEVRNQISLSVGFLQTEYGFYKADLETNSVHKSFHLFTPLASLN